MSCLDKHQRASRGDIYSCLIPLCTLFGILFWVARHHLHSRANCWTAFVFIWPLFPKVMRHNCGECGHNIIKTWAIKAIKHSILICLCCDEQQQMASSERLKQKSTTEMICTNQMNLVKSMLVLQFLIKYVFGQCSSVIFGFDSGCLDKTSQKNGLLL